MGIMDTVSEFRLQQKISNKNVSSQLLINDGLSTWVGAIIPAGDTLHRAQLMKGRVITLLSIL